MRADNPSENITQYYYGFTAGLITLLYTLSPLFRSPLERSFGDFFVQNLEF